ncbi:hypothetical protein PGA1_c13620 [Phaeobacter inhibens DSM 17395]|nr:hypothetical protein PGA1_c13620 [Phaeobacter inhibens DSM 17395]
MPTLVKHRLFSEQTILPSINLRLCIYGINTETGVSIENRPDPIFGNQSQENHLTI